MSHNAPLPDDLPRYRRQGKQYRNAAPMPKAGLGKTLKIFWDFFFNKPRHTQPARGFEVEKLSQAQLLAAPDHSLWRLGHSTVLLKLHGLFWLTDPVFSERASPVQWLGPKRFHQVPIGINELPPIEAVILSHDHYDHLDKAAVLALEAKTKHFLTPTGVGDLLVAWGLPAGKIRQLDWWQQTQVGDVSLVATPSQHFSGRGLGDGNSRLWCSWVIDSGRQRLFFSGDSGYFDGFKAIGEQYGPFDLTLMETGAYDANWPGVHMQPRESLQAHLDLQGHWLLPIHNGTFDLAMHAWYDPFEQIQALGLAKGVPVSTPAMSERLELASPHRGSAWWRELAEVEPAWEASSG
ncbi:MBL fold metallo-hydrolase [Gallaecimonas kandeliae]|uniref:MBL fold metallo-hydrolase n=1 Tax=Gallaecimonas kandeliae TaxID=3029055 RepID=UPI0026484A74|nr:MBL fold metallo-hydrolase [Gallaecimonas kandeliae]WKE66256.1 MBL fold metallo-hydrolase [Gallaecimonas kandeliae]